MESPNFNKWIFPINITKFARHNSLSVNFSHAIAELKAADDHILIMDNQVPTVTIIFSAFCFCMTFQILFFYRAKLFNYMSTLIRKTKKSVCLDRKKNAEKEDLENRFASGYPLIYLSM